MKFLDIGTPEKPKLIAVEHIRQIYEDSTVLDMRTVYGTRILLTEKGQVFAFLPVEEVYRRLRTEVITI